MTTNAWGNAHAPLGFELVQFKHDDQVPHLLVDWEEEHVAHHWATLCGKTYTTDDIIASGSKVPEQLAVCVICLEKAEEETREFTEELDRIYEEWARLEQNGDVL